MNKNTLIRTTIIAIFLCAIIASSATAASISSTKNLDNFVLKVDDGNIKKVNLAGKKLTSPEKSPEERLKEVQEKIKENNWKWEAKLNDVAKLPLEERQKMASGFLQEDYDSTVKTVNMDEPNLLRAALPPLAESSSTDPSSKSAPLAGAPLVGALPSELDWRNVDGKNFMTPVKHQSGCGSCWAFGAMGTAEAAFNIYNNNPDLDLNLAEQQLVSCNPWSYDCVTGGSDVSALRYMRDIGIVDESCFPYRASEVSCSSNICSGWQDRVYKIEDYVKITPDTTEAYKEALVKYGPLAIGVMVDSDFYYYGGGIYTLSTTEGQGHAVILAGYSDAGGYWIIKNSWGTSWGINGYMLAEYGGLEGIYRNEPTAVTGVIEGIGEGPEIRNPNLDETQIYQGEPARISATIIDSSGVDSAKATIRYPNEDLIEENLNRYYIPPGGFDYTPQTCSGLWGFDCGATCTLKDDDTFNFCDCAGTYCHVDEVYLSATAVTAGAPLKVTCTFDAFPFESEADEYIWYYDSQTWHKLYGGTAQSERIHNVSVEFTANSGIGQHIVRCVIDSDGTSTTSCQSGYYYDHDDVSFIVTDPNNPTFTDVFYSDITDTSQQGRYDITKVWAEDTLGKQSTENYYNVYFTVGEAPDNLPPVIANPKFDKATINTGESVHFDVTVTDDKAVDSVKATFKYPNGTEVEKTLSKGTQTYYYDFTDTSQEGRYDVIEVWAEDSEGDETTENYNDVYFTAEETANLPPVITNPKFDKATINTGEPVHFDVTVTDDVSVDSVKAVFKYPNGAETEKILSAGTGGTGTQTFYDGFESGSLSADWSTYTSNAYGVIEVTSSYSPNSGSYHVAMDSDSNEYATECIYTAFDMSGASGINLDFWIDESNDESHECPDSGTLEEMKDCTAYTCDGSTWYKLTDLSPGVSPYAQKTETNIDANCGAITPQFSIAFCHYDNYGFTSDGFTYDDITITYNQGNENTYYYDFTDTSQEGRYDVIEVWAEDSDGEDTTENYDDIYFTAEETANQPPVISNPKFDKTLINTGESVHFDVTVTDDKAVDSVKATFKYPNGAQTEKTLSLGAGGIGTQTFYDGFESGTLSSDWSSYTSNAYGAIEVTSDYSPNSGDYHVAMDSSTNGEYATECIYTAFDMSGASDINLNFWIDESGDESHECPDSGTLAEMKDCTAYTCDGSTWYKLTDLSPGPSTYTQKTETNIDANCGAITPEFSIAFCHYDNYGFTSDGFSYDDITITYDQGSQANVYYYDFTDTSQEGRYDVIEVWAEDSEGEETTENYSDVYFTAEETANQPPVILNPTLDKTQINTGEPVHFDVTVTDDKAVDSVKATFKYPNGAQVEKTLSAGTSGTGTQTFYDGFESGSLSADWSSYTSNEYGIIAVTSDYSPNSGDYHVAMDSSTNGEYATECIYTAFDMSGASDINLNFWIDESGDESHECPDSGTLAEMKDCTAYTCDGSTWYKLTDLSPGPSTYTQKTETNIDANCGAITPEFSIAFCHYDNYGFTSDGFTYDDITITYNQGSGAGVYSYDFTDTSQEGRYDVIEVWAEDSEGEETTENYNDIYFTAETPEPPVITNPVLDKTQVSQGESVRFSATITDSNGIDSARATIRYPNEDLIEENLNRYYIPPGQSDSTPQTCRGLWGSDCGVTCDTEEDNTFDDCNNCGGSYEHVDEVQIDATSVTAGTPIKVTCTFDPYDSSTGEYIWYYDAAAWHKLYSGYAPSGSIHDVSVDFTANNNLGTHAVRCIVVWAGTGTAPCQSNSGYYDHDDVTFLVVDSNNPVPTDIFYYDFTDTLQEGRYDVTKVWAEDTSGEQTTENYDDVYFMVS